MSYPLTSVADMHGNTILVGDRVKHYGQRYGYAFGTATVVGYAYDDSGVLKVQVTEDTPTGYGDRWDADRTENTF